MKLNDFDFTLPNSLIALRPCSPRHNSKLLVLKNNELQNKKFIDLPDLLSTKDVLLFNDTRVIPAQLYGTRQNRGKEIKISATLHKPISQYHWRAFVKGAKKLQQNDKIKFTSADNKHFLIAKVLQPHIAGEVELLFETSEKFFSQLEKIGQVPLPAYIANKRKQDEQDKYDYQTIYANRQGSIAAPTAGLHFTQTLFEKIKQKNIACHFLTLHVGAGTFLPVKTQNIAEHKMHSEWGSISAKTAKALNQARANGGRIICVGTTCLRLLESACNEQGIIKPFQAETDIFIKPKYKFRAVDGLITNFHLPRSTLFMLVCAFAGLEKMHQTYEYAIKNNYRFYSYGDGCLLLP